MTRDEIIGLFIENATKVAAEPVRVKNNDELNHVLAPIMVQCESIYCPGVTDTEKAIQVPPDKHNPDYVSASVCLEEVSAAIAETGSLICSSQGGKPVQAGLLAAHHVAILSADNIYESLDQFFSTLGDSPPTNITLETGPSRTADIELTLTIGVHGPGRLTVIVF